MSRGDTRTQLQQALKLIREGDKTSAAKILVPIIQAEPDNANAWFLAANATDDEEEARYALEQVLRLRPGDERAQAQLLRLSAPLGDSGKKLTAAYNPDRQIGIDPVLIIGVLIVMAILAVAALAIRPLLPGQRGVAGRIVFEADDGMIYLVNPDGAGLRPLVRGLDPAWDSSGNVIVYALPEGGIGLYDVEQGQTGSVPSQPGDRDPVFSPDSTSLLVSSTAEGVSEIVQITLATGDRRRVGPGARPAWSPDGTQIAYQSDEATDYFDVFVVALGGGEPRQLTNSVEFHDESPTWASAALMAFVSNRDGNAELYRMAVDGQQPQRLTDNPATDRDPAFSPDGQFIVFASNRGGQVDLYRINADGSGLQRLTDNQAIETDPSWGR